MSGILNIALSGLNTAATGVANAASSIVKASSTTNIEEGLVALQTSKIDYQANAATLRTLEKAQKSLIDITA